MHNLKTSTQVSLFLNAVIVVCCITLLVVTTRVSAGKHQGSNIQQQLEQLKRSFNVEDIRVTNRTSGFEIAGLEKTPERNIRIRLRNGYKKKITAYQISLGSTTTLVETMLNNLEAGVDPGEVVDLVEAINVDPDLSTKGLTIRAVVFDDGTGDGEPESIKEIDDYRQGEMIQMKQTANRLMESAEASDSEIISALDEVSKTSLSSMNGSRILSPSVRFGAEDTRKRIALLAGKITKQPDGNIKSGVTTLLDYCTRKSAQLSQYNNAIGSRIGSKAKTQ
jgi:hypothetical protein